jgi:hypothetical protein
MGVFWCAFLSLWPPLSSSRPPGGTHGNRRSWVPDPPLWWPDLQSGGLATAFRVCSASCGPPLSGDGRLCRCLRCWQPCTGPGRSGASWTRAPAGPLCPVTGGFGQLWLEPATPAAARAPGSRLWCGGLPPAPGARQI